MKFIIEEEKEDILKKFIFSMVGKGVQKFKTKFTDKYFENVEYDLDIFYQCDDINFDIKSKTFLIDVSVESAFIFADDDQSEMVTSFSIIPDYAFDRLIEHIENKLDSYSREIQTNYQIYLYIPY